jgi:(2Fe-2S) ferredoxin
MTGQLLYRRHVFCCDNMRPSGHKRGCCAEKGADKLRNYMKARLKELGLSGMRVNSTSCLDRCELGPVMVVYPEGTWYSYHTREDIDEIVESHLKADKPVKRLMLHADQISLIDKDTAI